MTQLAVLAYFAIGLAVGIVAGRAVYRDQTSYASAPHMEDIVIAGVTTLFVGAIWPLAIVVLGLGRIVAKDTRK